MDRLNPEGIPRDRLFIALKNRKTVSGARRRGSCLLCRRHGVNEAGLCDVCYAILTPEEAELAEMWLRGQGP